MFVRHACASAKSKIGLTAGQSRPARHGPWQKNTALSARAPANGTPSFLSSLFAPKRCRELLWSAVAGAASQAPRLRVDAHVRAVPTWGAISVHVKCRKRRAAPSSAPPTSSAAVPRLLRAKALPYLGPHSFHARGPATLATPAVPPPSARRPPPVNECASPRDPTKPIPEGGGGKLVCSMWYSVT
jgi:hypothetical protein